MIIMSRWYLSNKSFDRTLLLEVLNFMMFYPRTAVTSWQIDMKLSFGLFSGVDYLSMIRIPVIKMFCFKL
jgi:hypothetical protein